MMSRAHEGYVVGHVVSHMVDLSYVMDGRGPRKNMKNRQVKPLKCEEALRKYLLDPKVMKE